MSDGVEVNTINEKDPNEGTQFVMTCSGQSYPTLTDNDVTWTKYNNITFRMRGKKLFIVNINILDSGTYICSVVVKLIPTFGQPINVTGRTTIEVDVLCKYYMGRHSFLM